VAVQVAAATGRSAAVVGREALALNLWTWFELHTMEEEARVQRLGERVDLAGMVAMGFHEPKKLDTQHRRYLREAGLLAPMLAAAQATALETVAKVRAAEARGSRARPARRG
jgi:hypothetical protein